VRLVKIAAKAGVAYWLLKNITTCNGIKDMRGALAINRLLRHKTKFIAGTTVLIGLKEAYGATIAARCAKKMPAAWRLGRKVNAFITPSLF
jgi:hypothetical protein